MTTFPRCGVCQKPVRHEDMREAHMVHADGTPMCQVPPEPMTPPRVPDRDEAARLAHLDRFEDRMSL